MPADTSAAEKILKATEEARDEAKSDAKAAAADRAAAAIDAAEAKLARDAAEAAKKAAEEVKVDTAKLVAPRPPTPVQTAKWLPLIVSVASLVEDLSSDNDSTIDEAVLQLSRRPDAIPSVVEKFAIGDIQMKRRAWSCLKGMGEPARLRLNEIVSNPDRWEARILGAAREILIKGFRQNLSAEDDRENMAKCSELIQLMIANLNAKTRELRDINSRLQSLTQYGRLRDTEQTRELEKIRDEYKREIETLRRELESKGIKVIYTAIQVPVPVPIPQVQMVYPRYSRSCP